jgi:(p)ppGpp synthase/HD superfamily hydrolase
VQDDTGDEHYYQVALLHDVIEDGYTTMDWLVEAFYLS